MLRHLPQSADTNVLTSLGDDAVVYKVDENKAAVQNLDVITPIVDDPYTFGAIAAANALSDLYAVGATPAFCLNYAAFPVKSLPLSILEEILTGGADKASEGGAAVLGGHTIDDPTPKYGLSVTGFADPARLILKSGAQPGDRLYLTKPIGIGALTTAFISGRIGEDELGPAVCAMLQLNRRASEVMVQVGAHACTDITGFGLVGHLHSLCTMSGVGARVYGERVPQLTGAHAAVASGSLSVGGENNWRASRDRVLWDPSVDETTRRLLCDPQTSGGLLISVSSEKSEELRDRLLQSGSLAAAEIGEVTSVAGELVVG